MNKEKAEIFEKYFGSYGKPEYKRLIAIEAFAQANQYNEGAMEDKKIYDVTRYATWNAEITEKQAKWVLAYAKRNNL